MANELRHADVGIAISKAEWEAVDTHKFNNQAAGDIPYASSTSQLSRLGIGSAKQILSVNSAGTAPEWVSSPAVVTALVPDAADGATIGTAALEFSDVYLADASVIYFGADQEVTLTHVHNTGLLLNSTMAIQFNDASQYINAPTNAILDINATDEIELNATLADVNANLDVSGTYQGGGLMTTGGNIVIPNAGNIGSASDTDAIAISSGGVVTMNQIPVFSAGINVSGGTIAGTIATSTQNSITTMTGLVTTSALNSGSITSGFGNINTGSSTITTTGAADLGNTTVDNLTSTGTITGGSDGSGVDVVLYSGTAGDNLTWDASEEQLIITGTNGTTSLNVADGNVAIADDLDVDGTLEADAYTVDGTALNEYIADTVGAMVSSNTESGITVAYQDGDNTLDFTVGTLNQDTTGTPAIATTVTITDNESTDEDNAVIFTAGGDVDGGNLGLESDGNLTYNPSTGRLTATQLAGTLQTAAQTNITSVGTIGTGVWQGTAIASAYLDSDTAHLSGTQTFTGAKTFSGSVGMGGTASAFTAAAGLAIKKNGDNLYLEQSNADNGWIIQTSDSTGALSFERRGEGGSPSNTERMSITTAGVVTVGSSLQVGTIDFTDGDLAMTIADGGGVAFAQITTTPSIELRAASGTPYVDFTNHATDDYDARIILTSDSVLSVHGATFEVNGDLKATGDVYALGDYFYNYVADDAYGGYTIRNDTLDATHILWELSKRNTNEDLWLIAYNGTSWKNCMKWDWTDSSTRIPDGRLFLGEGNSDDNATIVFDGASVDFYVGLDHSASSLILGTGSTVGSNPMISLTNAGADVVIDTEEVYVQSSDSNMPRLILKNTNADATTSHLDFWKSSASPADNDQIGVIRWLGNNSASEVIGWAHIVPYSTIVADGNEHTLVYHSAYYAGTNYNCLIVGNGRVYLDYMNTRQVEVVSDGITIGDGGTEDQAIRWNGNQIDAYMAIDDSADNLKIGTGTTVGSNVVLQINATDTYSYNDFKPAGDATYNLGSTSYGWATVHISDNGYIAWGDTNHLIDVNTGYMLFKMPTDEDFYWQQGATNAMWLDTSASTLHVGTHDTANGLIAIAGGASTNAEGGELRLHTAADHDGTYDYWFLDAYQDDMRIGPTGQVNWLFQSGLTYTYQDFVVHGTTPRIIIGDGGTEDTQITFDGNAQDYYLGLDDSGDTWVFGRGSTVGSSVVFYVSNLGTFVHNAATTMLDNTGLYWGNAPDYLMAYSSTNSRWYMTTTDGDGSGTDADIIRINDGQTTIDANTTWDDNAFDIYDDAVLLESAISPTKKEYDFGNGIFKRGKDALIEAGILKKYEDGWTGYNDQRMAALLAGGIYQTRWKVDELEEEIIELKNKIKVLEGA